VVAAAAGIDASAAGIDASNKRGEMVISFKVR